MLELWRTTRLPQPVYSFEAAGIFAGDLDAFGIEGVQLSKLHQADGCLCIGHTVVETYLVEVKIPILLSHGMDRFVDRQIFPFGIIGAAAERAMREHALVKSLAAGCDHSSLPKSHH